MALHDALNRYLPLIEAELQTIVPAPSGDSGDEAAYYGMIHYHMGWVGESMEATSPQGGKRIRPLLCLLCCEAAGGDPALALPAAAAVELIHNFSLVHDDIQDGSRVRRGRRAVWDLWGAPHGINVGDGLFVLARLALHRLSVAGVAAGQREAATVALDQACLALCEGQHLDMSFEARVSVEIDHYLTMIQRKTAALLAASAQLGAIVAPGDPARAEHFRRFGENLGLAFQIQDDILGTWGDAGVMGKSTLTDLRDKKKTLPVVWALNDAAHPHARLELIELFSGEGPLPLDSIERTLEILEEVGARSPCEEMAARYYHLAMDNLMEAAAPSPARSQLGELAASLLGRSA